MIRLRQIKVLVNKNSDEEIRLKCSKILEIDIEDIKEYKIIKKSIDARDKKNVFYSYVIDCLVDNESILLEKFGSKDVFKSPDEEYKVNISGKEILENRIIIVGSGPCGLICGYMLASYGYKPLIIERGKDMEERTIDVSSFWETGILNIDSNVQFGLGGAGTYSDGKLNTLNKDKFFRQRHLFKIFVENGAPEEIMYESKPHIGTDLLKVVVSNIRNKIIDMGGEFRFNTKLTDIDIRDNMIQSIVVNDEERIKCSVLVLAIGHSARDTFEMLYNKKMNMESKPFAVGIRIQHDQEMINKRQYGDYYKLLGPASYKLVHRTSTGRGVYTFCMCPGGYVVNASSEEGKLSINGMSNYKRDSGVSNSAIIVTIDSNDYGNGVLDGVRFQRELESKAYITGNGKIPVSLLSDYFSNKTSKSFRNFIPKFKGDYKFANVNEILPDYINDSIKEGIVSFDKKIPGFGNGDSVISGVESRTSSPVRIIRDENGISNYKGIYPAGEGCGYAGGITSAGVDGIIVFEHIVSKYKKNS